MADYVEFTRNVDHTPIPHVGGRLHYPLANFFIYLRKTSMKRGGSREPTTISNFSKYLKIWFDYCADVGVGFQESNYDVHLSVLRTTLLARGLQPQSYNAYYQAWRVFYEWCDTVGIAHLMKFPVKIEMDRPSHQLKDLGFNKTDSLSRGLKDPGCLPVTNMLDFKDCVLNPTEYAILVEQLRLNDIVFEMIAFSMCTTGLRIGGVMQMPLGADAMNPRWLRYPELNQTGAEFQRLNYLPKGKKRILTCMVLTEALKVIHEQYIKKDRVARARIYNSKDIRAVAPLWLTSTGKQVFNYDVWSAFRLASSVMGRDVKPHHLRHTYATYVVYNYFKAHGLKPNLAYAHDIHEQLKLQLGHSDVEITKKYIRTVIRIETEAWLPVLTPHVKAQVDTCLPAHVLAAVTKFFEPKSM
ncbi:hypothetical protein ACF8FB_01405 [Pseudomonas sp. yb_2]|uniref:hypothetical protein n=1 Tax=Pseudomonas sp. yb_2 TaxID=3367218 RepID=UPI00370CCFF1